MIRKRTTRIKVTPGSGNVFTDLGFPYPEEELAKVQLMMHIAQTIKRRRLSYANAAALMGIDRSRASALVTGRFVNFSSERLLRLLVRLGHDVDVTIRAKPHGRAHGCIRVLGDARS